MKNTDMWGKKVKHPEIIICDSQDLMTSFHDPVIYLIRERLDVVFISPQHKKKKNLKEKQFYHRKKI